MNYSLLLKNAENDSLRMPLAEWLQTKHGVGLRIHLHARGLVVVKGAVYHFIAVRFDAVMTQDL